MNNTETPVPRNVFIIGKVRKHRFEGENLRECARCAERLSSVIHK